MNLNGEKTVTINDLETEGITWLTLDALKDYYTTTGTYTIRYDSYFVSHDNGSTKESLTNGSTYNYSVGDLFYKGEASYTAIESNATFFSEHADYLEAAKFKFVDYLPTAVGSATTVIFKTADGEESKAQINNAITCALAKCSSITTLNLADTQIPAFVAHEGGVSGEDPSFFTGDAGAWTGFTLNTTLTTLYAPCVSEEGSTLKQGVFRYLAGLKSLFLGEGITVLDEKCFDETQFIGDDNGTKLALTNIRFPNSLTTIKKNAFAGQTGIEVFVFPAKMDYIQEGAFQSANPSDVYFLGVNAPKVDANAWGDNSYISNNSLTLAAETTVTDGGGNSLTVQLANGTATRNSYTTSNGHMTMLHYPAACTKAQAARYTDITRNYVKIDYGTETEYVKKTTNNQDVTVYSYTPAKEESQITGKTNSTSGAAQQVFFNEYSNGSHFGGDYSGGYNDIFLGEQYTWPSMVMAYRATVVAQNNKLWDGVTSIAEGIKNAGDSDFAGTGEEYIGLHQFVFAQGDVATDRTDEWSVKNIADGEWHSICLPFDVTKAKMKETFGANAQGEYKYRVCKFHKVDRTDEKLKLYFNDEYYEKAEDETVVLKAHVSYMIKAKKENIATDEKIVIKDYVMAAGSPLPTNVTVNEGSASEPETTAEEGDEKGESGAETLANQYYFVGNYTTGFTIPQYSYFFSKTKKYFRFQTGTTGKWNGYTSIIEAPNGAEDYTKYFNGGSSQEEAKLATIWGDEDEDDPTGIEKVTIIAGDEIISTTDNVYNLSGQLVSTRGLNGLAKGIYVLNGKKYIVK